MTRHSFSIVALLGFALSTSSGVAFGQSNCAVDAPGVRDPQALAQLMTGVPHDNGIRVGRVSYPNFNDLAPRLKSVRLAAFQFDSVRLGDDPAARPEHAVEFVSGSYFDVLGVPMQIGRAFEADSDMPANQAVEAVVSHALWQSMFGAQPSVIGRTLLINGKAATIVGVASPEFRGMRGAVGPTAAWLRGVTYQQLVDRQVSRPDDRAMGGYYQFVARVTSPRSSWSEVTDELEAHTQWLLQQHPAANAKFTDVGFHLTKALFCSAS